MGQNVFACVCVSCYINRREGVLCTCVCKHLTVSTHCLSCIQKNIGSVSSVWRAQIGSSVFSLCSIGTTCNIVQTVHTSATKIKLKGYEKRQWTDYRAETRILGKCLDENTLYFSRIRCATERYFQKCFQRTWLARLIASSISQTNRQAAVQIWMSECD